MRRFRRHHAASHLTEIAVEHGDLVMITCTPGGFTVLVQTIVAAEAVVDGPPESREIAVARLGRTLTALERIT